MPKPYRVITMQIENGYNTTDAIAGEYTGSVMFSVRCE